MKTLLILLFGTTALLQAEPVQTPAGKAEAAYAKGVAAEKAGDAPGARTAYLEALAANPRHANARYRLGELKRNAAKIAARGREGALGGVTVPEIRFEDVSLQEALDALGVVIGKQVKDETVAGFIVQDPDGKLSDARITLHLKNVPAKTALDYIVSQAGAKARYDEHATVILPQGG